MLRLLEPPQPGRCTSSKPPPLGGPGGCARRGSSRNHALEPDFCPLGAAVGPDLAPVSSANTSRSGPELQVRGRLPARVVRAAPTLAPPRAPARPRRRPRCAGEAPERGAGRREFLLMLPQSVQGRREHLPILPPSTHRSSVWRESTQRTLRHLRQPILVRGHGQVVRGLRGGGQRCRSPDRRQGLGIPPSQLGALVVEPSAVVLIELPSTTSDDFKRESAAARSCRFTRQKAAYKRGSTKPPSASYARRNAVSAVSYSFPT